jgi:hypothetical protein
MNRKSKFIFIYPSRYEVVSVLKKIITSDFAETNSSVVPFLLLLNIVTKFYSVLGFLLLLLYYCWLYVDKIINWEFEKNTEISKYRFNILKGIIGMNRDLNMILVQFHKSYEDTREVFNFIYFLKKNLKN